MILISVLGGLAGPGTSSADDPHAPIVINGDADLASNACACVRNPGAAGTASDPYIISDWRIARAVGVGIEVKDVRTHHFIIRDNTVKAQHAIKLVNTGDRGQVLDNEITFEDNGIWTINASPRIVGNYIQGKAWVNSWWPTIGLRIEGGSPLVQENTFARGQRGIFAASSSPVIEDNEFSENQDAVLLTDSTEARLTGNTIRLAGHWGLVVRHSAKATLIDNEVREGEGGIVASSATLYMENNRVMNQRAEAVKFESSVVTMFRNTVSDNWMGAYGSTDSDVLIRENTFTNNQDAGIRLTRSEGTVEGNLLELNGVGIDVRDSIITLRDNEMNNNTHGLSIPYGSRQTIPLMSGNVVNGVNVDGSLVPAEKRLFYKAAGVTISGQTIDGGHGEGYFGTTVEQGSLVVYDSTDVTI
ncbi:MAG: right-handed parallel beta-helix repeat-containing protein, partial [Candidatus Thermoplasmatota archaeon]|nr:right-handed parallel beta-helix repeat-containing protein [Candidatus Thermoplasmatota archaeon]